MTEEDLRKRGTKGGRMKNEDECGREYTKEIRRAIAKGDLVFIVGAGISQGSGIIGYRDLTEEVFEEFKETMDEDRKEWVRKTINDGKYEEALGEIACADEGLVDKRVREVIASKIADGSSNSSLCMQKYLLKLSEFKGRVRIVTTNFDILLYKAACEAGMKVAKYSYDLLPSLVTEDWSGIVNLHGVIPEESSEESSEDREVKLRNLIITEEDYGRAYGTERRAGDFLIKLISRHEVCLVGYSANDPMVKYYLLGSKSGNRKNIYAFDGYRCECEKERQFQGWKYKGVKAIQYITKDDHIELLDKIKELCDEKERGIDYVMTDILGLIKIDIDDAPRKNESIDKMKELMTRFHNLPYVEYMRRSEDKYKGKEEHIKNVSEDLNKLNNLIIEGGMSPSWLKTLYEYIYSDTVVSLVVKEKEIQVQFKWLDSVLGLPKEWQVNFKDRLLVSSKEISGSCNTIWMLYIEGYIEGKDETKRYLQENKNYNRSMFRICEDIKYEIETYKKDEYKLVPIEYEDSIRIKRIKKIIITEDNDSIEYYIHDIIEILVRFKDFVDENSSIVSSGIDAHYGFGLLHFNGLFGWEDNTFNHRIRYNQVSRLVLELRHLLERLKSSNNKGYRKYISEMKKSNCRILHRVLLYIYSQDLDIKTEIWYRMLLSSRNMIVKGKYLLEVIQLLKVRGKELTVDKVSCLTETLFNLSKVKENEKLCGMRSFVDAIVQSRGKTYEQCRTEFEKYEKYMEKYEVECLHGIGIDKMEVEEMPETDIDAVEWMNRWRKERSWSRENIFSELVKTDPERALRLIENAEPNGEAIGLMMQRDNDVDRRKASVAHCCKVIVEMQGADRAVIGGIALGLRWLSISGELGGSYEKEALLKTIKRLLLIHNEVFNSEEYKKEEERAQSILTLPCHKVLDDIKNILGAITWMWLNSLGTSVDTKRYIDGCQETIIEVADSGKRGFDWAARNIVGSISYLHSFGLEELNKRLLDELIREDEFYYDRWTLFLRSGIVGRVLVKELEKGIVLLSEKILRDKDVVKEKKERNPYGHWFTIVGHTENISREEKLVDRVKLIEPFVNLFVTIIYEDVGHEVLGEGTVRKIVDNLWGGYKSELICNLFLKIMESDNRAGVLKSFVLPVINKFIGKKGVSDLGNVVHYIIRISTIVRSEGIELGDILERYIRSILDTIGTKEADCRDQYTWEIISGIKHALEDIGDVYYEEEVVGFVKTVAEKVKGQKRRVGKITEHVIEELPEKYRRLF